MIDKLKATYAKYREQITYIIFGGMTTIVNWSTLALLSLIPWFGDKDGFGYLVANAIAFIVAVIFAFVVNRRFVFRSKSSGFGAIVFEFFKFVATRLLSFGVEEILMWVFVNHVFGVSGIQFVEGHAVIISKIPVTAITAILNYIFGKFIVFSHKKDAHDAAPEAPDSVPPDAEAPADAAVPAEDSEA